MPAIYSIQFAEQYAIGEFLSFVEIGGNISVLVAVDSFAFSDTLVSPIIQYRLPISEQLILTDTLGFNGARAGDLLADSFVFSDSTARFLGVSLGVSDSISLSDSARAFFQALFFNTQYFG